MHHNDQFALGSAACITPFEGQGVSKQKGQLMRNLIVVISCPRIVLSGVLYHPHQQAPSSSSKLATKNFNAVVPYNPLPQHHSGRRNRRKNGYPNRPKANRSGYNFFFAEKHVMLKSLYPHKWRELTK
ncbi:hypothetical protein FXO38_15995 [Capsicum annuum]|nr:hypothetical protein FXO38_15995 [Capsicum annuum]